MLHSGIPATDAEERSTHNYIENEQSAAADERGWLLHASAFRNDSFDVISVDYVVEKYKRWKRPADVLLSTQHQLIHTHHITFGRQQQGLLGLPSLPGCLHHSKASSQS